MKKGMLFISMLVMLSVLSLVFSAEINAQSTNFEPRLVGTWKDSDNKTYVFNSDGTGNMSGTPMKYGAIDGKIVIVVGGRDGGSIAAQLVFSRDGKVLLIWAEGMAGGGISTGFGIILQKTT